MTVLKLAVAPLYLPHTIKQMIGVRAASLWPGALQAVCQPLLSPMGPIRALEWERLRIHTSVPTQGKRGWWWGERVVGVGRWDVLGVIAGQSVTDRFQPRYVTLISPVVTLASSLVSPSHAAHMPFIPRGDVLHNDWGVRERRVICPHALSSHWLIAPPFWCSLKWMSVWLCLPGAFSWALQNSCHGVGIVGGKVIFHHALHTHLLLWNIHLVSDKPRRLSKCWRADVSRAHLHCMLSGLRAWPNLCFCYLLLLLLQFPSPQACWQCCKRLLFFCFVCSCLVFGVFVSWRLTYTCQHRLTHCEPVFCPGSQMQNQKATVTIKLTCFDAFSLSFFFVFLMCLSVKLDLSFRIHVCFLFAASRLNSQCGLHPCKSTPFFHCNGMQREGIPLPKLTKRLWSSPLSASMPKLWMGIVFLKCQQLESRLPTFFHCVYASTGKERVNRGTMAAWSHITNV